MRKYIIKNCPSCRNYNVFGLPKEDCYYNYMDYCKNHSDCLLKQIVEKCKDAQKTQWVKNKKKPYSPSKAAFAREILKLLEIEEVNE